MSFKKLSALISGTPSAKNGLWSPYGDGWRERVKEDLINKLLDFTENRGAII
jgi:hypothetical protein